jgi:hypothetical protein
MSKDNFEEIPPFVACKPTGVQYIDGHTLHNVEVVSNMPREDVRQFIEEKIGKVIDEKSALGRKAIAFAKWNSNWDPKPGAELN